MVYEKQGMHISTGFSELTKDDWDDLASLDTTDGCDLIEVIAEKTS